MLVGTSNPKYDVNKIWMVLTHEVYIEPKIKQSTSIYMYINPKIIENIFTIQYNYIIIIIIIYIYIIINIIYVYIYNYNH